MSTIASREYLQETCEDVTACEGFLFEPLSASVVSIAVTAPEAKRLQRAQQKTDDKKASDADDGTENKED